MKLWGVIVLEAMLAYSVASAEDRIAKARYYVRIVDVDNRPVSNAYIFESKSGINSLIPFFCSDVDGNAVVYIRNDHTNNSSLLVVTDDGKLSSVVVKELQTAVTNKVVLRETRGNDGHSLKTGPEAVSRGGK